MPHEYGLSIDPRGLVQQLINNLNDRYKREAIPKELLQNADDARAARLEIGYSPGLGASAAHPLLRGPGLFVVNDGPFSPQDAEAIRNFGLNYKAADPGAIGKFGLGLKSVFHLCEAFFYRSGTGAGSFVNPWGGTNHHDDWNAGVEDALDQIERHLARLLDELSSDEAGNKIWFLLWLPLRRKEHCRGESAGVPVLLKKDYPGDEGENAFKDFAAEAAAFAEQLPLLRHVRRVRYWECWDAAGPGRVGFEVTFPEGQPRCRFLEKEVRLEPQSGVFLEKEVRLEPQSGVGRVAFGLPADPLILTYAIRQQWAVQLDKLVGDPGWPTSMSLEARPSKDKAQPHAAVTISHSHAAGEGQLSLSRAVFLPLAEDQSTKGFVADYSVRLHGCFFVDAGRGRPVAPKESRYGSEPSAEERIQFTWNERLLKEGACPLLLPALDELVRAVKPIDADIHGLTKALDELHFDGIGRVRDALLAGGQWAYCWAAADPGWRLATDADEFREVPDPEANQVSLPGHVLPGWRVSPGA